MKLAPAVRWLTAILLMASGAGCGGGSPRPRTPPQTTMPAVIETEAGRLTVVPFGCEPDLDRMVKEVNTTVRVARKQQPNLFGGQPLNGFEIHARTPEGSLDRCGNGDPACFERFGNRGRLHVWCDGGGLEHESSHALAHAVALPCWRTVYHDGVDFTCRRRAR